MSVVAPRVSDADLAARVLALADTPAGAPLPADAADVVEALLGALERGELRAAERGVEGPWRAGPGV